MVPRWGIFIFLNAQYYYCIMTILIISCFQWLVQWICFLYINIYIKAAGVNPAKHCIFCASNLIQLGHSGEMVWSQCFSFFSFSFTETLCCSYSIKWTFLNSEIKKIAYWFWFFSTDGPRLSSWHYFLDYTCNLKFRRSIVQLYKYSLVYDWLIK